MNRQPFLGRPRVLAPFAEGCDYGDEGPRNMPTGWAPMAAFFEPANHRAGPSRWVYVPEGMALAR